MLGCLAAGHKAWSLGVTTKPGTALESARCPGLLACLVRPSLRLPGRALCQQTPLTDLAATPSGVALVFTSVPVRDTFSCFCFQSYFPLEPGGGVGEAGFKPIEGHRHPVDCGVACGGSSPRAAQPSSKPLHPAAPSPDAVHPARQAPAALPAARPRRTCRPSLYCKS